MRPNARRGKIQPKISSMPRQKTDSSVFLDLYKLSIEKSRLQQELDTMERRSQEIQLHMAVLEQHMQRLQQNGEHHGDVVITKSKSTVKATSEGKPVDTIFLDY